MTTFYSTSWSHCFLAYQQVTPKCKESIASVWIHSKPSLFQHIGTFSSLKGKVQKLKDKQFGKVPEFVAHRNPAASVSTSLEQVFDNKLEKAYNGDTFFWAKEPKVGDYILFEMTPPVKIKSIKFVSGNLDHQEDNLVNATVELLFDSGNDYSDKFEKVSDNFYIVGTFDNFGLFETSLLESVPEVEKIRISVHSDSNFWIILSEIEIRPLS